MIKFKHDFLSAITTSFIQKQIDKIQENNEVQYISTTCNNELIRFKVTIFHEYVIIRISLEAILYQHRPIEYPYQKKSISSLQAYMEDTYCINNTMHEIFISIYHDLAKEIVALDGI